MFFLIPAAIMAVVGAAAGALISNFWDEIRGVIYRWLTDHGLARTARVFVKIEVFPAQMLYKLTTLVKPQERESKTQVDERVVTKSELPPEVAARRNALIHEEIEVTDLVYG